MKHKNTINLTKVLKPYIKKNLWVALNREHSKVVGCGKTIQEAIDNAKKKTKDKPVIMKAVQDYHTYVPYNK